MKHPFGGTVPYLYVDDARAALQWYSEYFGFEEIGRWENDQGQVVNAELRAGDTEIWVDGSGRLKIDDERPLWNGIWVEDVDAMHRTLKDRGLECAPPITRDFGVRMLNIEDGMGYLWGFMRRIT